MGTDRTLVFLHIPKTGGISLRELFLRASGGPSFRIIHPIDDLERLRAKPEEFRAQVRLVEGHLYYGVHELLPNPCLYATMLRDPVERVLSYYSFVREYRGHHLYAQVAGMSLGECLRARLTIETDNFMVRALTSIRNVHVEYGRVTRAMLDEAAANLETFAAVGLTERFDESVAMFARVVGWGEVRARRLNATKQRVRREELSEEDLALVREHNALDIELYGRAGEMVMARLGAGAAVGASASR